MTPPKYMLLVLAPWFWGPLSLLPGGPQPCAHASQAKKLMIRAKTADQYLKAGDILIEYEDYAASAIQGVIRFGQGFIKLTYSPFRKYLKKRREGAVHAAVYLGRGLVAEAEGTHPGNALVRIQTIDVHAGFRYLAYRNKDQALAKRAAWVARYWANGTIPYAIPGHVLFNHPKYNQQARQSALLYAKYARTRGGPPKQGMFCSQFVLAVYQAAYISPQLKANPKLTDKELKLPGSLALNANNVSPMDLNAHLKQTTKQTKGFQFKHDLRIDIKAKVKRKGVGDWILNQSGQLVQTARHGIVKGAVFVGKHMAIGVKHMGQGISNMFKGNKKKPKKPKEPKKPKKPEQPKKK